MIVLLWCAFWFLVLMGAYFVVYRAYKRFARLRFR